MRPPTFEDIQAASERIRPIAKHTPVMTSRGFNSEAGITAFFKCENFQTGGAFKIRGAWHRLTELSAEERERGVVDDSGVHGCVPFDGQAKPEFLLGRKGPA